jgi:quercetin dioxygenase-like cupin family protein/alkylhydroperoxidase/carboxymuconolactone decarboxylase family protein YurZ
MKQTAGHDQLGEFAPEFAHLNDDVLFGEVWDQEAIDTKTKCILTVTALMAQGITDSSLKYHLQNAKNNGVTHEEIAAIITHVTMYAGWPKGWAVFNLAKEVWGEDEEGTDAAPQGLSKDFPMGEPNTAYAQYFIGQSYLAPLGDPQLGAANVTFEPGCRNNWHIHHKGGQVLICIAGHGWYQEWGKPAQELRPGDVVSIQPEVKHWHGAAKDSWFQHIALHVPAEGASNEWLEAVSDEEYAKLG